MTDSDSSPNVQNPAVTWTIHYRRGTLRRKDSIVTGEAPDIEQIANCETRTGFLIDIKAQQFRRYNLVRFMSEAQRTEYLREAGKKPIPVDSETVDTGERKMLLGYAAKHFITTTTRVDGHGEQEIIDGWYIDHPAQMTIAFLISCVPNHSMSSERHLLRILMFHISNTLGRFRGD